MPHLCVFYVLLVENLINHSPICRLLGWSFTTLLNHKVAIWWRFFQADCTSCHSSTYWCWQPEKSSSYRYDATLWFSEVVNDHPNLLLLQQILKQLYFWAIEKNRMFLKWNEHWAVLFKQSVTKLSGHLIFIQEQVD